MFLTLLDSSTDHSDLPISNIYLPWRRNFKFQTQQVKSDITAWPFLGKCHNMQAVWTITGLEFRKGTYRQEMTATRSKRQWICMRYRQPAISEGGQ